MVCNKSRKKRIRGKRKKSTYIKKMEIAFTALLLTTVFTAFLFLFYKYEISEEVPFEILPESENGGETILPEEQGPSGRPEILQDFIEKNPYSRSGISLEKVNGIVVHYVSNPGSTARENRDYFENLKETHLTKASSHFIIGIEGEIIQCIPLEEISYASNDRNKDTISIECCHKKKNGKFTKETYQSLVQLTRWLCKSYGLTSKAVIRHYDVTGKLCPKYYVRHPDAWEDFLSDVKAGLE